MNDPATPSLTPAQIIALVQAVLALVVAFGVDVSPELQDALVQLSTVALAILPTMDAAIRRKRADYFTAKLALGKD